MPELDLDLLRSASHQSMAAHLTGPFSDGTRERPLPLDASGRAVVEAGSRQPLLLVAPAMDVGASGFQVTVKVSVGTTVREQVTLRFEPWSEAGAFLPAFHPDPLLAESAAMPALAVEVVKGASAPADVPVAQLVQARLVEGVMGRMLYALGAEKQRLRRQARELFAMRQLEHATRGALDRLGLELGVPRFEDRLGWDAAKTQPTSVTERESDASYRRRLALYRPFLMATPRQVVLRLNGPGESDANTGPLAALGVSKRFTLYEANTEFAVGLRLMGPENQRTNFFDHLRKVHLLAPASATPANRLMPLLERARQDAMLSRLRTNYTFPAGAFIAPGLAQALDLVGRCRVALGVTRRWGVLRAQADTGGSRYELGLGVEVEVPPADELTLMRNTLLAGTFAAGTDVQVVRLLQSLTPGTAAEDPAGRWLLAGCGLRTVHRTPGPRYYLSHVPIHGLVVSDESGPAGSLGVRLHAPEDTGLDAVLHFALSDVEADAGGAANVGTRQSAAAAPALWDAAATLEPPAAALTAFTSAGLRPPRTRAEVQRAVAGLETLPPELLVTLSLEAAFATGLLANTSAAVARLTALVDSMKRREVVSVLPLVSVSGGVPSGVLLVVGVIPLPARAVLLNPRREDFHWYVLSLAGTPGTLEQEAGSRSRYVAPTPDTGLDAVVTVTLVRRNRADPRRRVRPFETRVVMNPGARLDISQYEYLMNLLERLTPLGVVMDTGTLREEQVDPGGQGQAVPMTGLLARSFRAFQQRRHPGERDTHTVK
ncbi:hypothetical protein [Myxococcus sp. RHSTA-1-4]|uniref:hypothetical protein n=1 Tax=Myxococcus sp. RHSTA-1-4 TaxID=2874601 RepID=UPI001CBE4E3C|nr:hypothetical protein [Myxococcus sp. RHSTA-1-4]MBZ4422794.1 hypothetical protein [Myxococcus sp. RHSTA-1-4]